MKPEPVPTPDPDRRRTLVDRFAMTLLLIAADQDVRVLEALASLLVRQARLTQRDLALVLNDVAPPPLLLPAKLGNFSRKLQLCRRIARRALHGSPLDPAPGATAFHRIDENPAWARHLLPVAIIGSFLFYELAEPAPARDSNASREAAADSG